MREYRWVYLCADAAKLRTTLKWLPRREPFAGLREMTVPLWRQDPLPVEGAPSWLRLRQVDVTPAADALAARLPPAFAEYYTNPKVSPHGATWCLGIKLLLPLIFEPPLLYTDDDVLVPRDPAPLMGRPFCGTAQFDKVPTSPAGVRMCEQLAEVFGLRRPFDPWDYNRYNLETGHWYADELPGWWDHLVAFWDLPFVAELPRGGNAFRTLDLRFFTAHAIRHRWRVLRLVHERRIYQRSPEALRPRREHVTSTHFVHYCASSHKEAYREMFESWAPSST